MKEKPFLSTTLCKVDGVLALGQPPCIKICHLLYFSLPLPKDIIVNKNIPFTLGSRLQQNSLKVL